MADLTLTSSAVVPSVDATLITLIAGVAIAAGQPVYQDTADLDSYNRGKAKLADANASTPTAIVNGVLGLAASSAGVGQPVSICLADPAWTHGLTGVVKGDIIILSATAGGLAPAADLASGHRPSVCLVATSTTQAVLKIINGPVAK